MLPKINGLFRLTRDAELKDGANQNAVLSMGLAASEKYKDNETPCFLDAVVFSKPAEIISQYAGSKGTQIFLTGKLKTEQWQDKQTGANRSKVVMIIEGFDFVSGQNAGQNQGQQPAQSQSQQGVQGGQAANQFNGQGQPLNPQQMQAQQRAPANAPNDFDDINVPF